MSTIIKNLDRSELENMVVEETRFSQADVKKVLNSFFKNLIDGVSFKEYAEIHGLGSFRIKRLAPDHGADPLGNPYSVGERAQVEFNAFEPFRDKVESTTGLPCIE